ncbi:MAG: PP2C family protein-serine/threonine phosphatase [Candidatus Aminicenantes bacterium]|nr:PP2C family protein-serine/threonine phosphatase [Candidatus Aminicenantes bacterium]
MSFFRKIVALVGNIGADPSDSEQVRLLKRIWTITLALAVPLTAGIALTYLLMAQWRPAVFWLIQAVFWFGSLFLFAVVRKNIEIFALSSQTLLVLSSFVITCLLGGFFRSDGAIFMGLIGVLYAMVFPNRRRAFFLFLLYLSLFSVALIFELTIFRSDAVRPPVSTFFFWITFVLVAAFTVFTIYYFVGQRDRTFRLLQAEKERSESLLRRIEKDLELAAKIQRDFLPRHDPRIEHFEISGSNVSCYEVGGDYYDFVPVDPYRLGIAVGDVSGKGIGAALLMASLRAALRAEIHPRYRIEDMAAKINDFVYHSSAISSFITFFYCEVDRNREEVLYVNAGHNPPLVLRTDGSLETLEGTGFCLGMFSGAVYEAKSVRLKSGDIALLYTDGIPESRNADGAEYSMERLVSLLRRHARLPAAEIVAAIAADAKGFIRDARQCDDQTLVVIKRTEA